VTDSYPDTEFRRIQSSLGMPTILIRVVCDVSSVFLTLIELCTKMTEVIPRQIMTPLDTMLTANAEIFTFYQLLNTLPRVEFLSLTISKGFPWKVNELQTIAECLPASVMLEDLRDLFGDSLNKRLSEQHIDVSEMKDVESAQQYPNLTKVWITALAVQHRANYYTGNIGFMIKSRSLTTIYLMTTRHNIVQRYETLFHFR